LRKSYANFRDLSIGQHLFLGLRWLLDKIINIDRFLLILFFALAAVFLRNNSGAKVDKILGSATAFIAAFLVVFSLNLDYLHPKFQEWFQQLFFSFKDTKEFLNASAKLGQNYNFYLFFIPYLIWIPILLSIPYILYRIGEIRSVDKYTLVTLFSTAIASLALMFFSPTIFASGNRIIAVYSVILLFIICNIYYSVQDRIPLLILLTIYMLAAFNLLFQMVEWSHKYFIQW